MSYETSYALVHFVLIFLVSLNFFCSFCFPKIGRRIFRLRLETGDREADVEQRRVCFLYFLYVNY